MYKSIKNHERYFINCNGIVTDFDGEEIRYFQNNSTGYLYVLLDDIIVNIHEAVAEAFIPNNNNLKYVKHKDNDILHNHVSNLEWSDIEEEVTIPEKKYSENSHLFSGNKRISPYIIYNEEKNDYVICQNRSEVANTIQYELISLKNMIGNGRVITLGPYAGYKIDRIKK